MAIKISINGFGRIGRATFKQALERPNEIEVVAINDLGDVENLAYLLRYDSVYGRYEKKVEVKTAKGKNYLVVEGKDYLVLSQKDPVELPWGDLSVDVVAESTGIFTTTEKASAHLKAGAKRVVISAPAKDDETPQLLAGTNELELSKTDLAKITSDASCTTNAVVPLAAILLDNPGILKSIMTTAHGYTASQKIQDGPSKRDYVRGRAAALNIIPTSTGSAKSSSKALPDLKDKFDAIAIRVPVIAGSIIDYVFLSKRKTSVDEINDILRKASKEVKWKGIFTFTDVPLVSTDILGNTHAAIADLALTRVVDGDLVKVMAWYDNEWGYTYTLLGHILAVGKLI